MYSLTMHYAPDTTARGTAESTAQLFELEEFKLSIARVLLRSYTQRYADHWVCTMLHHPVLLSARVTHEPNEWGDRVFAEVTYAREGYRTYMGGRVEGHRIIWSIYMD